VSQPHSGRMKTVLIVTASLVLASTLPAAARSKVDATVIVRTYDYANLAADELGNARTETAQIFGSAGISVKWIDCLVPGRTAGEPCTDPLLPGRDLMLRLVDRIGGSPGPRDRPRDRAPAARKRRAWPAGVDAGALVERRTAWPKARQLGLFAPRSRPDAANPQRPLPPRRLGLREPFSGRREKGSRSHFQTRPQVLHAILGQWRTK
jgi:hypothetical protein